MTYVDAYYDREEEKVLVVERHNGVKHFVDYDAKYITYYEDSDGTFTSMFGTKLKKYETTSNKEFKKELKFLNNKVQYESDINPIFRCLEENYRGLSSPDLHVAFFDIEVDFDPKRGYAPVEDPFNEITAISVYLSWLGQNITLCLHPNTLTYEQALQELEGLEDTYVFETERELLETFLDLIDDADVLTGWNSTKYDIPYIVQRVIEVLSKEAAKKFCLWGLAPRKRKFTQFKKEYITFDIYGKVHIDYLDLYRKHNPQQLHTYRLDYVGEIEIGENKVPYEGSLDQLYKQDYRKFIEYNKQDVMIMVKLDAKRKFIDLANQLAHTNTVLIPTTMGSVALVEQAIINEAHDMGFIVPNRKETDDKINDVVDTDDDEEKEAEGVAGAYVVDPKIGLHDYIGAVDINSLYPSTIRTLNMGPETLIGQLRPTLTEAFLKEKVAREKISMTEALHDLFGTLEYQEVLKKSNQKITIDFELPVKQSVELKASEVYELLFEADNHWCISANGTIFKKDKMGVIPHLLARWYNERKEMQAKAKDLDKQASNAENEEEKKKLKAEAVYWTQMQQIRKILLNSLYGALLNPYCRFYDKRVGQSVTLTGRCITKHMASKINEILAGEYDHMGDAVQYGDSVTADSKIRTNTIGERTIEELFNLCLIGWTNGDREYAADDRFKILTYDPETDQPYYSDFEYIFRHETEKDLYEIEDEYGNIVTVTEDHSIMVERDGDLIEVKPTELLEDDLLISIEKHKPNNVYNATI